MPKAFSDHEKKMIGERLLDQGELLFSKHGIGKTTVEELARSVGISKAAFYIFYESKESLFMDVVERAENHYRQELLALIGQPGPSPRARLKALFTKAFTMFGSMPILHYFTTSEYDLLFRRVPEEKLREHLASDQRFMNLLVEDCQKAGIPIRIPAEEMSSLMYLLLFSILHQNDFGQGNLAAPIDTLLELIAAYCLGEVEIQSKKRRVPTIDFMKGEENESGD